MATLILNNGRKQTAVSLFLFAVILCTFAAFHVFSIFIYDVGIEVIFTGPVLISVMSWLFAGLFIIAHDAMHGSLAPGHNRINSAIGAFVLFMYAGFDWGRLKSAHMRHHNFPGTKDDPDFNMDSPEQFWPWYIVFMKRYFGIQQLVFVSSVVAIYYLIFKASLINIILFYGAPAILSSAQLFYFGTYLPHRREATPFADKHRARSNDYNSFVSLMTCFHFGYHREHHLKPETPWWQLPKVRKAMMKAVSL